jgi:para-nitrobenzyl esterase
MDKQIIAICEQGSLAGIATDGVLNFFDIPYAETGGRFRDAKPPGRWSGTRDCTRRGPIFPQLPSRLDFVQGPYTKGVEQSEDAFRLNIFTPSIEGGLITPSIEGGLPVLFWIHGGGFMTGGCALKNYSGASLAKSGRCVVVAVNYRLGVLGNLYLPGVADGNYSVRDLEAALFWVRRNIQHFSGDPEAIVVAGQSAGAWYTQLLIGMKSTSEAIRGAVVLSAPSVNPLTTDEAIAQAGEFCSLANISDPARQLPGLPIDSLLSAQAKLVASRASYGSIASAAYPMQDGRLPPDLAEAAAHFAPKPLIIGWTREEAGAFLASDPQLLETPGEKVLGKFKEIFGVNGPLRYFRSLKRRLPGTPYSALVDLVTDKWFKRSSIRAAKLFSRAGGAVYTYQLEYQSSQPNVGACHCFDIPFWLGNFEDSKDGPMLSGLDTEKAAMLSSLMQGYLLNFLHSGDPNSADLPVWEPCRNGQIQTIHFGDYIFCAGQDDFDSHL